MTKEEIKNIKEGAQKIISVLDDDTIDLSSVSFDATFIDALTGNLQKEQIQKIQNEKDKYRKMIKQFLDRAESLIFNDAYLLKEELQNITPFNMNNYYILGSLNIIGYPNSTEYGSFYCIFDLSGNLIFSTKLKEKIKFPSENHFFIYGGSGISSYCKYVCFIEGKCMGKELFLGANSIYPLSDRLIAVNYSDHKGLYNLETEQVVLNDFHDYGLSYKEFKNVESGKYILIQKNIELKNNRRILKFFIDFNGNLVSDVFDVTKFKIYPLDVTQSKNCGLGKIYQEVFLEVQEENLKAAEEEVNRKNIYQMELKKNK